MTAENESDAALIQARQALADAETRLAEWETFFSVLRHDLRGALSPALLIADRLAMSDDAQKKRAGDIISASIDRASNILLRRIDDPPADHAPAPAPISATSPAPKAAG